jgi:glutamate-ammonia-ligase adenylyltransferase
MRSRLAEAKASKGPFDVKPGPGGVQDIELIAQAGALIFGARARRTAPQLQAGVRGGWLTKDEADRLTSTYRLARAVQSVGRLLVDGPIDVEAFGQGGREVLARETGIATMDDLVTELAVRRAEAAAIIDAAMGRVLAGRAPA